MNASPMGMRGRDILTAATHAGRPFGGIRINIFTDVDQGTFTSNNFIEVISLPYPPSISGPAVHANALTIHMCCNGFETTDDSTHRNLRARLHTSLQHQNTVHVVGHHNKPINSNGGVSRGQRSPCVRHHHTCSVQDHLIVSNSAEQVRTILRVDCDEIHAGRRIIVFFESYRPPISHRRSFRVIGCGLRMYRRPAKDVAAYVYLNRSPHAQSIFGRRSHTASRISSDKRSWQRSNNSRSSKRTCSRRRTP